MRYTTENLCARYNGRRTRCIAWVVNYAATSGFDSSRRSRGSNSTVTRKRIDSLRRRCVPSSARVGSIVISGSDRRGWRGIWAQKKPERTLCPRRISLSSPLSPSFSTRIFFFSSLLPVSSYSHFFYRKTSPRLDAMRDTGHPEGGLAAVQAAAKKPEIS